MDNVLQILQPNNPLFYLLIAWSVIWKGLALWPAARNRQLVWYLALLIVNTVGEIRKAKSHISCHVYVVHYKIGCIQ